MQETVRVALTDIMRRRGIDPIDSIVDKDDLMAYHQKLEATGGNCEPCTTIEDFIFDVESTPKSPWNKSAGRVFARWVVVDVLDRSDREDNIDEVAEAFYTRVKTLRYKRSRQYQTPAQRDHAASMTRRDSRKYQVRDPYPSHVSIL